MEIQKSLWDHFVDSLSKDYFNFSGRARRREFWGFTLFTILISWALTLLDMALFQELWTQEIDGWGLNSVFSLVTFIPSIAVGTRRLHDVGKSGWMQLLYFFIFIGWIWLLVLFVTDSHVGENKYGPNPKGEGNPNEIDQIGVE